MYWNGIRTPNIKSMNNIKYLLLCTLKFIFLKIPAVTINFWKNNDFQSFNRIIALLILVNQGPNKDELIWKFSNRPASVSFQWRGLLTR
jgi:hypothetical protein